MAAPVNGLIVTTNTKVVDENNTAEQKQCDDIGSVTGDWGFNLDDLYALATSFLKEKEGKAFHLSYKAKLSLVAFTQQVTHGKFIPERSPPVGYLDIIGKDRRQAWSALGTMSEKDAKKGFIQLLDELCPLFRPFIQAHRCHLEEQERRRREEEKRKEEEEAERLKLAESKEVEEDPQSAQLKYLIQAALNRQTFHQFKAYAEQQCPGDTEQQALLIHQLQKQHYQQYMHQVLNQQLFRSQDPSNLINMASDVKTNRVDVHGESSESTEDEVVPPIAAASMWTQKDFQDFKDSIKKEGGDGIIKVGHGETVTVRVPTHDDGTCLFWEFATDNFDIGFGVYFEWTKNPDSQVSVHISESEDEDDDEDEDIDSGSCDIEKGVTHPDGAPLSVIIPVYRRDCHEEVYSGSHVYPGKGVYLLKFDNSYSLWRSKTLYYRVYYTR